MLQDFEGERFGKLAASIREADDPALTADLEIQFEKVSNGDALLARTATELNLTVPFGHDPAVRAALQVVVTAVICMIMLFLVFNFPITALVATVTGSPTAVPTWKAVGKAYDRLYDKQHYHPEKRNRPLQSPKPRNQIGSEDVW